MTRTLSHYEIAERLGAGGMAEVYRARDTRLGREVAIKLLPAEAFADTTARERLLREARMAAALNHPQICTIHDVGEADGQVYVAMELVHGRPLSELIPAGGLPPHTALRYGIQIADALAHAHGHGVIHRDLKSSNVMITPEGRAKVLDFGIARRLGTEDPPRPGPPDSALTETGVVVGTPDYLAPELLRGDKADARSDVWSLGVLLHEMVAGQLPFHGRTRIELSAGILHDPPAPLPGRVPAGFGALIGRCLSKDPDARFQHAAEVRVALEAIQGGEEAAVARRSGARRARVVAAGLTAAVAVGALAATWLVWRKPWLARDLELRQVTSNPPGLAVSACAISPDGRRVAYADESGLFLKLIETGETERLGFPGNISISALSWFPDGTSLLVTSGRGTVSSYRVGATPNVWVFSLLGSKLRKLWEGGQVATVSPDGSRVALENAERSAIWVMGASGGDSRHVVPPTPGQNVFFPAWSPDGRRLAYVKSADGLWSVETRGVMAGDTRVAVRGQGNAGILPLAWTPDDRIVFGLREPSAERESNLWEIRVDRRSGQPSGQPRRLTSGEGYTLLALIASSDGRRLGFLRGNDNADAYVAEIGSDGRRLTAIRPLTRDVRYDWPAQWTRDGQGVLFVSDRNGNRDLFVQGIEEAVPEGLAVGPGEAWAPRFSPDGAWLFYWLSGPKVSEATLMRVRTSGGAAESLFAGPDDVASQCRCAISPDTTCVLAEKAGDELVFHALDPVRGNGVEVARMKSSGFGTAWDLSPDGARLAIAGPTDADSVLRIVDIRTKSVRLVRVPGWSAFQWVAWDARGQGWFVSSWWKEGVALLRVDPDGRAHLLRNSARWLGRPAVSPDGRRLAFGEQTRDANVWIAERPSRRGTLWP